MEAKQEIKKLAKRVQNVSKELGYDMKFNHALELVSRIHFNQSWHVVSKRDDLKTNVIHEDESDTLVIEQVIPSSKKIIINRMPDFSNLFSMFKNKILKKDVLEEMIKDPYNQSIMKKGISQLMDEGKLKNNIIIGLNFNKSEIYSYNAFENNIIFSGGMGSGNVIAARFSILSTFIGNSDKMRLWICDPLKGAMDFKMFDKYKQVKRLYNNTDDIYLLIDNLYEELEARKKGNISLDHLEKHVVVLEEWEGFVNSPAFKFNENYLLEGSIANKFFKLCQANKYGIQIILTMSVSNELKVNKNLLKCFSIRNCFKNDSKSSENLIGDDRAFTQLTIKNIGSCFNNIENSLVHFFFLDDQIVDRLLSKYVVKNELESITNSFNYFMKE